MTHKSTTPAEGDETATLMAWGSPFQLAYRYSPDGHMTANWLASRFAFTPVGVIRLLFITDPAATGEALAQIAPDGRSRIDVGAFSFGRYSQEDLRASAIKRSAMLNR